MPGMVAGKIGEAVDDFWIAVDKFVNGSNAAAIMVTRKDVADAAEYVSKMGYDLQGYGFLTEADESGVVNIKKYTAEYDESAWATYRSTSTDRQLNNTDTLPISLIADDATTNPISDGDTSRVYVYVENSETGYNDTELKRKIVLVVDVDGNVLYAQTKYLAMYLTAENASYLVRNYNMDLDDRIVDTLLNDDFAKFLGIEVTEKDGCGLIYFASQEAGEINPEDYIVNADDLPEGFEFVGAEKSLSDVLNDTILSSNSIFNKIANLKLARITFGLSEAKFLDLVQVNRPDQIMRVFNGNDGFFKISYYDYPLDGWITRYGIPLQLSLSMHLSTLAPDFAYEFAKIATVSDSEKAANINKDSDDTSTGTVCDVGLLKTKGNTVKGNLLLDLGDGEKYYYLNYERKLKWHITRSGEQETGEENPEAARERSREDSSGRKADRESLKDVYPTAMDALQEIRENLDSETSGGSNKKVAGILVFRTTEDGQDLTYLDSLNVHIYSDSGGSTGKVGEWRTTISDEYIREIQDILIDFDLAYYDDNGRFKSYNPTNAEVVEAMKIIEDYYVLESIENSVGVKDLEYEGVTASLESEYCDTTIQDAIDSGVLSTTNPVGETASPTVGEYYYDARGYAFWIVKDGEKEGLHEAPYSVYLNSDIHCFVQVHILGDYENIADLEPAWEYLVNQVRNWIPFRNYYQLVDAETDIPVTQLKKPDGKYFKDYTSEDYEFVDGAESYWPNEDGWFWRNTIPRDLIDAINNKIEDDSEKLNAKQVQELLDDIFEFNVGRDDTEDGGFIRYIPVLLEVKNHWYRDTTFKDCYKWDTSEQSKHKVYLYEADEFDSDGTKNAAKAEILYLEENSEGTLIQIKDGERIGEPGRKIKELMYWQGEGDERTNKDDEGRILYYKYDGNGRSEEPTPIDFMDSSVDAIAMLEQIQGQDAQSIIRDYKLLMRQFGLTFEARGETQYKMSLFTSVVDGVTKEEQILPEGDNSVIQAEIPPAQSGFEEGLSVKSPTAGKVTYRSDDAICIEIDEGEGGKHTGYTILISGFDVGTFSIKEEVGAGQVLGTTRKQDIKLVLRNENGAVVRNSYTSGIQEYKEQDDDIYRLAAMMHHEFCAASGFVANAKVRDEAGNWVLASERDAQGQHGGLTDISRTVGYVVLNNVLLDNSSKTLEEYINNHPEAYGEMSDTYNSATEDTPDRYCETCLANARHCLKYDCGSVVSSEGVQMSRNCKTQSSYDVGCTSAWGQPNSLIRWWLVDADGDGKVRDDCFYSGSGAMDSFFLRDKSYEYYEKNAMPIVKYNEDDLESHDLPEGNEK